MKILVAEDEPSLNNIITKRLKNENYSVDSALDGQAAWEYLQVADYDAAVVDIMMPKLDGLTLVKRLRQSGRRVPVLFLTAKDTTEDKVAGLDSGGDDYLVKPFEFAELLARIRALLRRHYDSVTNILQLGDLQMDCKGHTVTRGGRDIELTGKEYALLEYLLQNAGQVLTRQQILEHVWDFSYDGASNMIDVYINTLRKKIDREHPVKLLHTLRGLGYALKA